MTLSEELTNVLEEVTKYAARAQRCNRTVPCGDESKLEIWSDQNQWVYAVITNYSPSKHDRIINELQKQTRNHPNNHFKKTWPSSTTAGFTFWVRYGS